MKRRVRTEHNIRERWLVPYSDFVTVLLCFFIVMYSLSTLDAEKFAALARALQQALGGGGNIVIEAPMSSVGPDTMQPLAGEPSPSPNEHLSDSIQLAVIEQQIREMIKESGIEAQVETTTEERGLVISIQDTVLFDSGSAELTPFARQIMDELGLILLQTPNYLRVEGHTDNRPINTPRFPSNWELSVARSTSVIQYLIARHNFPPERLGAAGYGEYRPKAPNNTAENQQLNRRVDFVILSSRFEGAEPVSFEHEQAE